MAVKTQGQMQPAAAVPFNEGRPVPSLPKPLPRRAAEKVLAIGVLSTVYDPHTEYMIIRNAFLSFLDQHASHMSASRRSEVADQFAAVCDPVKPMKWALKPEGEDFATYCRREWRDRGYIAAGLTAADVARYDPQFAEIYRTNLKRDKVPEDCRFAKAGEAVAEPDARQTAVFRLRI